MRVKFLSLVLTALIGGSLNAGQLYSDDTPVSQLPTIKSVLLKKSFSVLPHWQGAFFFRGDQVPNFSGDLSAAWCTIELKEAQKNGAIINPNSVPIRLTVDHVEKYDGGNGVRIFISGSKNIESFNCSIADHPVTLGEWNAGFGEYVELEMATPDVIDPIE